MKTSLTYEPARESPAAGREFGPWLWTESEVQPARAAATTPIRVLLADGTTLVLAGLRFVLSRVPDFEIVGEAHDSAQALSLALRTQPHVIVLDLALPGCGGLDVLDEVSRVSPGTRTVVLSQRRSEDAVRTAFEHGAAGYFLKDENVDELPGVVRAVHAGRFHLSAGTSRVVVRDYVERGGAPHRRPLTNREREVLRLVASGKGSRDIGAQLGIATRTVHTHRAHIMRKLDVHTEAGLVHAALRLGIFRHE
jgi:two-component system response regulator NreC